MSVKPYIDKCLKVIGQTGFGGVTVEAGTAVGAMETLLLEPLISATAEERSKVYRNLQRQKLLQIDIESKGRYRVTLTPAGAYRLSEGALNDLVIRIPKQWDYKWRMVTYDIPATKSHERYVLVSQLKRLGFSMVQKSVWFYPYPCIDIIEAITESLGISRYVTIAEVSELDRSTEGKLHSGFSSLV
jgi:DNA-binding transcriptional regulator PaaX